MAEESDFEIVDEVGARAERHGIAFGDDVRIADADETRAAGYAGRTGVVFGLTTPSSSHVDDIIGAADDDLAVSVWFEDRGEQRWFAPSLVAPLGSEL